MWVGQMAFIQYLQQQIGDVRVTLLKLIKQYQRIWPSPHSFSQSTTFLVSDIAGWWSNQSGCRVLIHIFGHINSNHRIFSVWLLVIININKTILNHAAYLSNRNLARALHNWVFPTPVGPKKKKDPSGLLWVWSPARQTRTVLLIADRASGCPTTCLQSSCSIFNNLSFSPTIKLATGIPVDLETIVAMSSAHTALFNMENSSEDSYSLSSFCNCGISRFSNSPALARLPCYIYTI